MALIPNGSVDAIICDLPYGTTACKWDTVIPLEPLWAHYKRLIKPNGAIVLFGAEPFSSYLRMSAIAIYKYDIIWEKNRPTNVFQIRNCFGKTHENISVFSKANISATSKVRMEYNPQGVIPTKKMGYSVMKGDNVLGKRDTAPYKMHGLGYPRSVLKFDNSHGKLHPTQKPVALLEYLIRTYTNEGETVLDNTMGSGSTGVACVNTNRNFIGIEKDDKYFEIAKQRIGL